MGSKPRALRKGDRAKVIAERLRHFGHIGRVRSAAQRCIWVEFDDGMDAPFSRCELRALPPRQKGKR
jgi:hypothetical protein